MSHWIFNDPRLTPHMRGTIVVGAHHGQEHSLIKALHIKHQIYFEPGPAFRGLQQEIPPNKEADAEVHLFNIALWDKNGELPFYINPGTANCSFLPVTEKKPDDPTQTCMRTTGAPKHCNQVNVPTETLDGFFSRRPELDVKNYNVLMLDCQGVELPILKHAVNTLKHMDMVFTEINYWEFYEGASPANELDTLLKSHGFICIDSTRGLLFEDGHRENRCQGDATYCRPQFIYERGIAP